MHFKLNWDISSLAKMDYGISLVLKQKVVSTYWLNFCCWCRKSNVQIKKVICVLWVSKPYFMFINQSHIFCCCRHLQNQYSRKYPDIVISGLKSCLQMFNICTKEILALRMRSPAELMNRWWIQKLLPTYLFAQSRNIWYYTLDIISVYIKTRNYLEGGEGVGKFKYDNLQ